MPLASHFPEIPGAPFSCQYLIRHSVFSLPALDRALLYFEFMSHDKAIVPGRLTVLLNQPVVNQD